jgi:hypothetical protein
VNTWETLVDWHFGQGGFFRPWVEIDSIRLKT